MIDNVEMCRLLANTSEEISKYVRSVSDEEELRALLDYEVANRGRRSIVNRIFGRYGRVLLARLRREYLSKCKDRL